MVHSPWLAQMSSAATGLKIQHDEQYKIGGSLTRAVVIFHQKEAMECEFELILCFYQVFVSVTLFYLNL